MGSGLLEKVYERSLVVELDLLGHKVERQVRATARYKGVDVGFYVADLVVDGTIVVELKVGDGIVDVHRRQVLNYARALELPVGLILNFNRHKAEAARVVQWDLISSKNWA
jgi:GxxExxY protein